LRALEGSDLEQRLTRIEESLGHEHRPQAFPRRISSGA
jgi:hypothetical protein